MPIGAAAQMRHRRQHIERIAAWRRQRRIVRGRAVQIQAEVLGEKFARENVAQKAAVARAHDHGVVVHVGKRAARAEIPDEQAHGVARACQPRIGPAPALMPGEEFGVGPAGIGVGDNDVRRDMLAAGKAHAGGSIAFHGDLLDLCVQAHGTALPLHETDHGPDDGAGSAHGVMHAMLALEVADQRVVGRGGERISADQQRMKAEGDTQLLVAEIAGNLGVDRAVAAEPDDIRRGAQNGRETVEWLVGQFAERHLVDFRVVHNEALEARDIGGFDARDLGTHRGKIRRRVEDAAVIKTDLVERVDAAQVDVVRQVLAAQRPEFLEQVRRGDDGGPGIEGETVLPVDVGAAAWRIELFQQGDAVAARAEPDGRGKAAEAGANHHGMRPMGRQRVEHGVSSRIYAATRPLAVVAGNRGSHAFVIGAKAIHRRCLALTTGAGQCPEPRRAGQRGAERQVARPGNQQYPREHQEMTSMAEKTLKDAFHETLKDVYYAEKQSVRALKKSAKAAKSPDLKKAFEMHGEESATQVERLTHIFELIGKPARAKTCEAMQGLTAEMDEDLEDFGGTEAAEDVLIGCAQAMEHYEIARYGLLKTWARKLGLDDAEKLLGETLEEEKQADMLLTRIAEQVSA